MTIIIIRVILTIGLLWFVYQETGWATTTSLGLIALYILLDELLEKDT